MNITSMPQDVSCQKKSMYANAHSVSTENFQLTKNLELINYLRDFRTFYIVAHTGVR